MLRPAIIRGAVCACVSLFSSAVSAVPIISEVFYDAVGADNGKVFVELFGDPGGLLDGLVLEGINGSNGATTHLVALTGLFPVDGVLVVADVDSGGTTQVANADLMVEIDLQNGPDSLVLRDAGGVLDALAYGDFSAAFFAGEGMAAPDVASGSSLARLDLLLDTDNNLADFSVLATPTPGIVPMVNVMAVPEPGVLSLMACAALCLGVGKRRRHLS